MTLVYFAIIFFASGFAISATLAIMLKNELVRREMKADAEAERRARYMNNLDEEVERVFHWE